VIEVSADHDVLPGEPAIAARQDADHVLRGAVRHGSLAGATGGVDGPVLEIAAGVAARLESQPLEAPAR